MAWSDHKANEQLEWLPGAISVAVQGLANLQVIDETQGRNAATLCAWGEGFKGAIDLTWPSTNNVIQGDETSANDKTRS